MVRLAEQMGAMALVDELRHRHMQVDEQLDLPRRREEVAQRIRAYYAAQRIEVDDDLIGQGVRAYFAGRLQFQPPDSAAPGHAEALVYVQAQRHGGAARPTPAPVTPPPSPGPSLARRVAAFLGLREDR